MWISIEWDPQSVLGSHFKIIVRQIPARGAPAPIGVPYQRLFTTLAGPVHRPAPPSVEFTFENNSYRCLLPGPSQSATIEAA